MRATEIVDLGPMDPSVGKANPERQPTHESDGQVDAADPEAARTEVEPPFALTTRSRSVMDSLHAKRANAISFSASVES